MRRLIIVILLLTSLYSEGQIINASPAYRPVAAASCSYLLDQYSGAAAAYSLRKLDCDYAGYAIRVRRSSDNSEQDIGFTSGGDLDTATLKTFVGANSGFITTWYDQSGYGNNISISTSAYQPTIISSGSVIRVNGKIYPTINGQISIPSLSGKTNLYSFIVHNTSDQMFLHAYWQIYGLYFSYVSVLNGGSTNIYANYGSPVLYSNNSLQLISSRNDVYSAMNGNKIICMYGSTQSWSSFYMFGYQNYEFSGSVSEMIFYETVSSISGVNNLINSYYNIY